MKIRVWPSATQFVFIHLLYIQLKEKEKLRLSLSLAQLCPSFSWFYQEDELENEWLTDYLFINMEFNLGRYTVQKE